MNQSNPGPEFRDAHFAAIIEHTFDAIVSKDLQGNVGSWNHAAERLFGWSSDEIVGKSIRTIIPPDRFAEEDDIIRRVTAGDIVPKFETVRTHKTGKLVPVAITIAPIRDRAGQVIGASKIAHDISETVRHRTLLEQSERQFRTLANSIPQLAWIADTQGSIFWYNDRWYAYTGTTLETMKGWGWVAVHHPEHVERVKARIQESWDNGTAWEDTFPLRGADGQYRWFLSRAMPLRDDDGNIWRWFGTNTDITEQRDNQQQIELLMRELNHRAKNMITVVQALVSRTAGRQFSETLAPRLQALSRNQDILTKRNWDGAPVGELIVSQLAAVGDLLNSRVFVEGDIDHVLSPAAAETIGLAIHELTTNATKYGALSAPTGKVRIDCSVAEDGAFVIHWTESGGPPVEAPKRTGFGTVMIDRNPRLGLHADVQYGYPPEGFFWRLSAPPDRIGQS